VSTFDHPQITPITQIAFGTVSLLGKKSGISVGEEICVIGVICG